MAFDNLYDDSLDNVYLPDEGELKKEMKRIQRQMKNLEKEFELELTSLRDQRRDLIEKNMQLTEANNIFARGLEHLKKDSRITTEVFHWHRGGKTLEERIKELTDRSKRIVAMATLDVTSHGDAKTIAIVTEFYEKVKSTTPDPRKIFGE